MKLVKVKTYFLYWHNPVVTNSASEAYDKVKSILEDIGKIAQLEKEGKIGAECGCDSPSFQIITVLDKSIEMELQQIGIVSCYETEIDEDELPPEDRNGVTKDE
jgi:hypothetical protein